MIVAKHGLNTQARRRRRLCLIKTRFQNSPAARMPQVSDFVTKTGVGWHLSAAHRDRLSGQVHGHTWFVIAWHICQDRNDAVILQMHLKTLLASFDHTVLPDELAMAEDFAAMVLKLSQPSCVEVEIRRGEDRLYAKASR